ncbi:8754_t:CDS:2 [Diversispora eburnea]|uniref:8754_t:CDS:1 n=1 Tax=Diversispora eburnea TaxID=1213867 RepID=A0A9N8Z9U6_9GLOM|nr:8754_t:CDS:2 [Diversispora eburnea]
MSSKGRTKTNSSSSTKSSNSQNKQKIISHIAKNVAKNVAKHVEVKPESREKFLKSYGDTKNAVDALNNLSHDSYSLWAANIIIVCQALAV